jgi:hypothetical protein
LRRETNLGRSVLKGRWWLQNVSIIPTLGFVKITWMKKTRGKRGRSDLVLKHWIGYQIKLNI